MGTSTLRVIRTSLCDLCARPGARSRPGPADCSHTAVSGGVSPPRVRPGGRAGPRRARAGTVAGVSAGRHGTVIIAVGDEVLGGFTADSNSHWLAGRVREAGYPA